MSSALNYVRYQEKGYTRKRDVLARISREIPCCNKLRSQLDVSTRVSIVVGKKKFSFRQIMQGGFFLGPGMNERLSLNLKILCQISKSVMTHNTKQYVGPFANWNFS